MSTYAEPCPYCGEREFVPNAETQHVCSACGRTWGCLGITPGTGLAMYTVVEATFHVHPFLSDEDGEAIFIQEDVTEYLVRMNVSDQDGDWVPVGCETWYGCGELSDAKLAKRATLVVLAAPEASMAR